MMKFVKKYDFVLIVMSGMASVCRELLKSTSMT